MNHIKEVKNILNLNELLNIYNKLIDTPAWYLSRMSHNQNIIKSSGFPGFIVSNENNIYHQYWFGYFEGLLHKIKEEFKKQHNILLPEKIHRIHLVAKNENSDTSFHTDIENENALSIIGFLTPSWDKNWGGEFICEDESVTFTPGTFLCINSNKYHNGLGPKIKTPYWRVVVNYILI